jgi:DNA polymerase-1
MKALIDAEFYLYRCAAGAEYEIEWASDEWSYVCRHGEAQTAFQDQLATFLEQLPNFDPVLVFSDGPSFRYSLWPSYKANRKKYRKPAGYRALIQWVKDKAPGRGWQIATLKDVEGDDILGILCEDGDVICSGDKDMLTLPAMHLRQEGLIEVTRHEADLAFYSQALTGDASDNYPGCPKYGPVTAGKLLAGLKDERDMWAAVVGAYEKAGFNERYALAQARCARILRTGEYDHKRGTPLLWNPPVT